VIVVTTGKKSAADSEFYRYLYNVGEFGEFMLVGFCVQPQVSILRQSPRCNPHETAALLDHKTNFKYVRAMAPRLRRSTKMRSRHVRAHFRRQCHPHPEVRAEAGISQEIWSSEAAAYSGLWLLDPDFCPLIGTVLLLE
jgi:hypothetical protein